MVRRTDGPAMTIAVDMGRKATKQTKKNVCQSTHFGVSSIQNVNNIYADHISIFNNIQHILILNKNFYNKPFIIILFSLLH